MKKCVLAYSGGLDTSVMIPWLKDQDYEVYCVLADVGQNENFCKLKKNALDLGAKSCEIISCADELSNIFKYSCFLNAKYEGKYYLGTALTRPFIAKVQIEYAKSIGCKTLVHGATGKGNDQIRFEYAYKSLAPNLEIISPWKNWKFQSRKELISYLSNKGYQLGFSEKKDYSVDKNVWHTSIEGGELEKPKTQLSISKILEDNNIQLKEPSINQLKIEFRNQKLKINGEDYTFFQAIDFLNKNFLSSWSIDLIVENRQTGIKSRGIYITPGAKVLYKAFESLVSSTLNKKSFEHYEYLSKEFSNVIYNGEYFSLQFRSILAGLESLLNNISGEVTINSSPILYVSKIQADKPLFTEEICTFDGGDISHADSVGFINLSWLSADGGIYK